MLWSLEFFFSATPALRQLAAINSDFSLPSLLLWEQHLTRLSEDFYLISRVLRRDSAQDRHAQRCFSFCKSPSRAIACFIAALLYSRLPSLLGDAGQNDNDSSSRHIEPVYHPLRATLGHLCALRRLAFVRHKCPCRSTTALNYPNKKGERHPRRLPSRRLKQAVHLRAE